MDWDNVASFGRYFLGVISFSLVILSSGSVIAYWANPMNFRRRAASEQLSIAALAGTLIAPTLSFYAIRFLPGSAIPIAAFAWLPPPAIYLICSWRGHHKIRFSGRMVAAWLGAVIIVGLLLIDIRVGDQLQVGMTSYDYAEHFAVTNAIARTGIPPQNPSLYEGHSAPLFYYYGWYAVCSFIDLATGRIIGAPASNQASAFWAFAALIALTHCVIFSRSASLPETAAKRWPLVAVLGFSISGLNVLPVIAKAVANHVPGKPLDFPAQLTWWNDQGAVFSWLASIAWVPHHVAAFVIALFSLLMLRTAHDQSRLRSWRIIVLAAIGLASSCVSSIWITIVAATIAIAWIALSAWRQRYREALTFGLSGVLSVAIAALFLIDLIRANTLSQFPLALTVRPFTPLLRFEGHAYGAVIGWFVRLAFLPVSYLIGFGFCVPALAGYLQWRRKAHAPAGDNDYFWLVCSLVPLIVCGLLVSRIQNNDFGWRGVLFAQFCILIYSLPTIATLFSRDGSRERIPPGVRIVLVGCMIIGFIGTMYDAVAIRFGVYDDRSNGWALIGNANYRRYAAQMHDGAAWIATHTPPTAIIQLDPPQGEIQETFLNMYGNRQAVISDGNLVPVFGASPQKYREIANAIRPLFAAGTQLPAALSIIDAYHIDFVVVKAQDAIWNDPSAWVTQVRPAFSNAEVAIYDAETKPLR